MAAPLLKTVTEVVTEGLKHAGRTSPTAGEISNAASGLFRLVKKDMVRRNIVFPELLSKDVVAIQKGLSTYAMPSTLGILLKMNLINPSNYPGYRDTAQAGSTASTLVASTNLNEPSEDNIIGKWVGIYEGTGLEQLRQIISWSNSTKVLGVSPNWDTTPDNTSKYVLGADHPKIHEKSYENDFVRLELPFTLGTPEVYAVNGLNFELYPVPNNSYLVQLLNYQHIDRIDESSTVFRTILTKHEDVFIQGVAVKGGQRWDEDRYANEFQIYNAMLGELAGSKSRIRLMRYLDA